MEFWAAGLGRGDHQVERAARRAGGDGQRLVGHALGVRRAAARRGVHEHRGQRQHDHDEHRLDHDGSAHPAEARAGLVPGVLGERRIVDQRVADQLGRLGVLVGQVGGQVHLVEDLGDEAEPVVAGEGRDHHDDADLAEDELAVGRAGQRVERADLDPGEHAAGGPQRDHRGQGHRREARHDRRGAPQLLELVDLGGRPGRAWCRRPSTGRSGRPRSSGRRGSAGSVRRRASTVRWRSTVVRPISPPSHRAAARTWTPLDSSASQRVGRVEGVAPEEERRAGGEGAVERQGLAAAAARGLERDQQHEQPGQQHPGGEVEGLGEHVVQHAGVDHGGPAAPGGECGLGAEGAEGADDAHQRGAACDAGERSAFGSVVVDEGQEEGEPGRGERAEVGQEARDGSEHLEGAVAAAAVHEGAGVDPAGRRVTDREDERALHGVAVGRDDPVGRDVGAVGEIRFERRRSGWGR